MNHCMTNILNKIRATVPAVCNYSNQLNFDYKGALKRSRSPSPEAEKSEKQKTVKFSDLEAESKAKVVSVLPKNTEFDIPTAIETLWIKQRKNENKNIASFEGPAAAWSVTDVSG